MLFKEGVTVPEGFVIRELGAEKVGHAWIKGKDIPDVSSNVHVLTEQAINDIGLCPNYMKWSMEVYNNTRINTHDENGDIILDYYMPLAQSFENLGKRIIHPFIATYPPFKTVTDCSTSEKSQKQMYDFLYDSITAIYDNLSIIRVESEPDDCFQFWQLNSTKPDLINKMNKIKNNFYSFYELLIKMGLVGEVVQDRLFIKKGGLRITQSIKDKLTILGLMFEESKEGYTFYHEKYEELFPAWKLHACILKDNKINAPEIAVFLHGRFDSKQYTAAERFGKISDEARISALEKYFLHKGYCLKNEELSVAYEKEYPNKQKAHLKIFYDWKKVTPLIFECKAPHFSKVLKQYDQMDTTLKDMVYNKTKTCDGCGYCTQTDKTGKRPRLAQVLEWNGNKKPKCPLFPSFVWDKADDKMIDIVTKLFDFSENAVK